MVPAWDYSQVLRDLKRAFQYRYEKTDLMFVISHDAVHLAQIFNGSYILLYGFSIWEGQEYVSLPPDHPNYSAQPWEAEANELSPILLEYLKARTKL